MPTPFKLINELFDEGTFAFSNRIYALIDDDIMEEPDLDPDIETILAAENI